MQLVCIVVHVGNGPFVYGKGLHFHSVYCTTYSFTRVMQPLILGWRCKKKPEG